MMHILSFWRELLFKPKYFFENKYDKSNSPYLVFVVFIFGLCYTVSHYNSILVRFSLADFDEIKRIVDFMNDWTVFWIICIPSSFVIGMFYYYIGGWIFQFRVWLSGGQADAEVSRFIYLYTYFLPSIPYIYIAITNPFMYATPLDNPLGIGGLSRSMLLLSTILNFHAIYISYIGVRYALNGSKWKTRIIFIFLPLIPYIILLFFVLFLYAYFSQPID